MSDQTQWESFKVEGGQLLDQFKNLVHEGNVRRIVIKRDGKAIVEFPLSIGVGGAALVAECTIEVERVQPADDAPAHSDSLVMPSDGGAVDL